MNLVIIGRFPAATDTQIRAFLPADREVFITEWELSGPFLQSADALIPEHIPIPSFGDKALKLRMIQTGAGYGEDRAVCFSGHMAKRDRSRRGPDRGFKRPSDRRRLPGCL